MAEHNLVCLSAAQRRACLRAIDRSGASTRLGRRALILLHADLNTFEYRPTDEQIGTTVGVTPRTVARVRAVFAQEGFESALHGHQRSAPRATKLSPGEEAVLLAILSTPPPLGFPRWTVRTLADHFGRVAGMPRISRELVRRTLNRHMAGGNGTRPLVAEAVAGIFALLVLLVFG